MSTIKKIEEKPLPQPGRLPGLKKHLGTALIHLLLLLLVFINIFPLYWMITFSLKSGRDPVNEIQGYNYTMDVTRWEEIRDGVSAVLADGQAKKQDNDALWERVEGAIVSVLGDVSDIQWTAIRSLISRSVEGDVRKVDKDLADTVSQELEDNWDALRAAISGIDGIFALDQSEDDWARIKAEVEDAVNSLLPSSPTAIVFSANRWKNIRAAITQLAEQQAAGLQDPWDDVKNTVMGSLDRLTASEPDEAAWDGVKASLAALMGDQKADLDSPRSVYVPPNLVGLPKQWTWSNYENAMKTGNMGLYFFNSLVVSASTIVITIIAAFMATYAITRLHWRGRKMMNKFFMLGLTIPIHAAIVPVYIILSRLKLLDTYVALILPYSAFSLAMAILISVGFMGDIPYDLDEAAFLDGCGVWGIFFRVIVPLMMPAISTVGIYTFLQCWNELLFANIFVSSGSYRTLPVGVQQLFGRYTTDWGPIGAALTIATVPTLIVYVLLSKRIQAGFIAGAVKG